MVWGSYLQGGNADWELLERLGSQLSLRIDCAVHYPAYDKRLFECKHTTFPRFAIESANSSSDWSAVIKHHKEALSGL